MSKTETISFDPSQHLWVEKYRPQRIEDCILPERLKQTFQNFVTAGEFPSLLLSGGAGVGKTTVAKALCNELGIDWILINASSERGIDVLRNEITSFASTVSFGGGKFKCVILDEFDHSTPLLQAAMRSAIEDFSKTCVFIGTVNYPNKIIDPLKSRMSLIDVTPTKEEKPELAATFFARVKQILKNENVNFTTAAIRELILRHAPDYRRILNELQKLGQAGVKIDEEAVATTTKDVQITRLVAAMKAKDFPTMRQWVAANIDNDVNILFRRLYDALSDILEPSSIPEAIIRIAEYQFRGVTCPDPEINFTACCLELMVLDFKG